MNRGKRHIVVAMLAAALAGAVPALAQESKGNRLGTIFQRIEAGPGQVPADFSRTTGDSAIDQQNALDLLSVWNRFHAAPNFYYNDDRDQANAFWTAQTIGPESKIQFERHQFGTMVFGRNLVAKELRSTPRGARRNYTIYAILCHESAHMVQFVRRSQLSTAQRELQADFLAGWAIGCEKRGGNPDVDESEVFGTFYRKGDFEHFRLQHHGTKRERMTAFLAGFDVESDDLDVAFAKGEQFVKAFKVPQPLTEELQSLTLGIYFGAITNADGTYSMLLSRFPAPDTPAGRAGLELGDRIVELNSMAPRTLPDVDSLRGRVKIKVIDVRTDTLQESEINLD
jgi:hypothetical protein